MFILCNWLESKAKWFYAVSLFLSNRRNRTVVMLTSLCFKAYASEGSIASSPIFKAILVLELSLKLGLLIVPGGAHARSMALHEKHDPNKS